MLGLDLNRTEAVIGRKLTELYNKEEQVGEMMESITDMKKHVSNRSNLISQGSKYMNEHSALLCDAIMNLNSVAISHNPGEQPFVHGPFRLVKYVYFLLENYLPMHAELCKASSVLLCEYFKGHPEVKPAIDIAEERIAAFKKDFFGK